MRRRRHRHGDADRLRHRDRAHDDRPAPRRPRLRARRRGRRARVGDAAAGDPRACSPTPAIAVADLDAIAFGRGPGAFTGLRTACSVAQGLAFGAGKPVLPIDSLLAVAEDARGDGATRCASGRSIDARMDQIYAAEYEHDDGRWTTRVAPFLTDCDALAARWRDAPPPAIAGNALRRLRRAPRHRRRAAAFPTRDAERARPAAPGRAGLGRRRRRRPGARPAALRARQGRRDRRANARRAAARRARLPRGGSEAGGAVLSSERARLDRAMSAARPRRPCCGR